MYLVVLVLLISPQVMNAQLFALHGDGTKPTEEFSLLEEGAGGCCAGSNAGKENAYHRDILGSTSPFMSQSCAAAAEVPMFPWQGHGTRGEVPVDPHAGEVCCHLQRAAVTFASNSLRFFGRQ